MSERQQKQRIRIVSHYTEANQQMINRDEFDDQYVDKVEDAVRDIIKASDEPDGENYPKRDIYTVEDGLIVEKSIISPSSLIGRGIKDMPSSVEEASQWIHENPDKAYTQTVFPDPLRSDVQPEITDIVHNPTEEQLIARYKEDLIQLAAETVARTGLLEYEEDSLIDVLNFFHQGTPHAPIKQKPTKSTILWPLANFRSENSPIKLESEIEIENRETGEWVESLEIDRITPEERASIYTIEDSREIRDTVGETTHAVRAVIHSIKAPSNFHQIIHMIVSGLRLFKRVLPETHGGPRYDLYKGPLWKRENIKDVRGVGNAASIETYPRSPERYSLNEEEQEEFKEFWQKYKTNLNTNLDTDVAGSIRRMNEMYAKENEEDAIIDCAIGFEGTTLKGGNSSSTRTFRMMLRASLLISSQIELERGYIQDLAKHIYRARGDIVHQNMSLNQIIGDSERETIRAYEDEVLENRYPVKMETRFLHVARLFLSEVILMYLKRNEAEGESIEEINQEIDQAALNAPYPQSSQE